MSKPDDHDPEENALYEAVAKRIRFARLRDNLTQRELAERIQAKRSYIFELESGSANPTLRTLYRLGKAFGIAPADLLPDTPHPELSHENIKTFTDKCDAIFSMLTRHSDEEREAITIFRHMLERLGPMNGEATQPSSHEAAAHPRSP